MEIVWRENQMNERITKLRVVVIDDENIVADTLVQILTMYGYDARAHYSGETALADAKEFRPEVVLSDVQMGEIDGIETANRLRAILPACRIVLFTASPLRAGILERIRQLGFEYLERPLHPREVLAILEDESTWPHAPDLIPCPVAHYGL